ncbi:MAG: DUF4402 domain-containing protein [Bacteroidales bacterium]|jgi:hypothetical protein|nr:DUF4402 domain-containing protein [Bacteroidales bacterium]
MINIKRNKRHILRLLLFVTSVFLFIGSGFAQPGLPQREITVLPTQPIDFGVFCVSGAGTITVDYTGNVTTSGGVVSLDQTTVTPAIFEIKLCQGRTVTIDYDYSVWLDGSNAGQLELFIGPTEHGADGAEFPVNNDCNFITVLRVGGTLDVPANPVPGVYIGSFPMTFTQK